MPTCSRTRGYLLKRNTCFAINGVCSLRAIDGHQYYVFVYCFFVFGHAFIVVLVVSIKLKWESGRDSSHELFNRVKMLHGGAACSGDAIPAPIFKRMPMNTFSISMDDDDDGTRRASLTLHELNHKKHTHTRIRASHDRPPANRSTHPQTDRPGAAVSFVIHIVSPKIIV